MHQKKSALFLVCLLGSLGVISPFSIDMYLPAFPQAAAELGVTTAVMSLSLSSYFIGIALGQIFYGPLLDRFGRKRPLYAGLTLYILGSFGCYMAPGINALVAFRFIQAIGGCVAQVGTVAMVRDFFPVTESAKILSLIFLCIAVSPLLAPSIGGMVLLALGWRWIFLILACIVAVILAVTCVLLPEGHTPDPTISLRPKPIVIEYLAILKHPIFFTYALSGAFSFAGLFTYVAGSPIIFMEGFHLTAQAYSAVFAVLAVGFIGGSQVNVALLRRNSSETLFANVLKIQVVAGLIFVCGSLANLYGLTATLVLFFAYLSCAGITYPNAAALALAPFSRNAGSASALLGFLQLGLGSLISMFISVSASHESFPIIAILSATSIIAMAILIWGKKRARTLPAFAD